MSLAQPTYHCIDTLLSESATDTLGERMRLRLSYHVYVATFAYIDSNPSARAQYHTFAPVPMP